MEMDALFMRTRNQWRGKDGMGALLCFRMLIFSTSKLGNIWVNISWSWCALG